MVTGLIGDFAINTVHSQTHTGGWTAPSLSSTQQTITVLNNHVAIYKDSRVCNSLAQSMSTFPSPHATSTYSHFAYLCHIKIHPVSSSLRERIRHHHSQQRTQFFLRQKSIMSEKQVSIAPREAVYCEPCWQMKISELSRLPWCNACLDTHPALLLSQDPRYWGLAKRLHHLEDGPLVQTATFLYNKMCAGHISVCAHKKIPYMELRSPFTPWQCTECIAKAEDVPLTDNHTPPSWYKPWSWSRAAKSADQELMEAKQPKIEIDLGITEGLHIVKSWRVPIFRVDVNASSGCQLVPTNFIRNALQVAESRYRHVLCGHMSFNDGSFLKALELQDCQLTQVASNDPNVLDVSDILQAATPAKGPKWWRKDRTSASSSSTSDIRDKKRSNTPSLHSNPSTMGGVNCDSCGSQQHWLRSGSTFFIEGRHDLSCCRLSLGGTAVDMELICDMDAES